MRSNLVHIDDIWIGKGVLAVGAELQSAKPLPVGPDGYVLTADSTQELGLRWGVGAGGGTYGAPALILGTTNIQGGAAVSIPTNSTIAAFDVTNPTISAVGDAAAVGSAAVAARRDHTHGREAFGGAVYATGSANVVGSALTLAHSDHIHQTGHVISKGDLITFDTAPQRLGVGTDGQVLMADSTQGVGLRWAVAPAGTPASTVTASAIGDSSVVGTLTSYAREDHKHGREAAGTPVTTGTSNSAGSAATIARSDHVHQTGVNTTKGDLLTYTTAPARLPVGTDAQILIADSTQSSGLKWGRKGNILYSTDFSDLDNTGSTDASSSLATHIGALTRGQMLKLDGDFLVTPGSIVLTGLNQCTIDARNARIFTNAPLGGRWFDFQNANEVKWFGARCSGEYTVQVLGKNLTLNGAGTSVSGNNCLLTLQNDYCRLPNHMAYGRDKDGNVVVDVNIAATNPGTGINGDISVEYISAKDGVTVLFAVTWTSTQVSGSLATVTAKYPIIDLRQDGYWQVRKRLTSTDTITVGFITRHRGSESDGGIYQETVVSFANSLNCRCRYLSVDAVGGWAWQIGYGNTTGGQGIIFEDYFSYACRTQGVAINVGSQCKARRGIVRWAHGNSCDIEPSAITRIDNCSVEDLDIYDSWITGISCPGWDRIGNLKLKNIRGHNISVGFPGTYGLINGGGSPIVAGNMGMVASGMYNWEPNGSADDLTVMGQNVLVTDCTVVNGVTISNSVQGGLTPSHIRVEGKTANAAPHTNTNGVTSATIALTSI